MEEQQLRDEVVTLFAAGHETTAKLMTWAWVMLATHPHEEARLHAELETVLGGQPPALENLADLPFTRRFLEETLRLYPPVWITSREAEAEDELLGYDIPPGTLMWLSPWAVHRHPSLWPEPECFVPDRFLPDQAAERPRFAYFPFGGGPHLCIGRDFALMEAQLVLATLAQQFRLTLPRNYSPEPEANITLRPRGPLPMRVTIRE